MARKIATRKKTGKRGRRSWLAAWATRLRFRTTVGRRIAPIVFSVLAATIVGGVLGFGLGRNDRPDGETPPSTVVSVPQPAQPALEAPATVVRPGVPIVTPPATVEVPDRPAHAPRTPVLPSDVQPAWLRHAAAAPPVDPQRPRIAIVFDDLGLNPVRTRRVIALPGPLTLSLLTYGRELQTLADEARAAGHEVMVHVPMAPTDGSIDAGPNVLRAGLPPEELRHRIDWALGRFTGFVGINNHMGSGFTADTPGMALVMRGLKERGLLFLDSMTSGRSVGAATAVQAGVPVATRDVFLDHEETLAFVSSALVKAEAVARSKGHAIAIGHPHERTIEVVAAWLAQANERGFDLVPVSAIIRERLAAARVVQAKPETRPPVMTP